MSLAQSPSANALIIRQTPGAKTLTIMRIPNPHVQLNANQGAPSITTQNTRQFQLPTDAQAYVSLLAEGVNLSNTPVPLNGNVIIIWVDSSSGLPIFVTVIPDTGQSGAWVSYTSSLNTTLGALLDQLYVGL